MKRAINPTYTAVRRWLREVRDKAPAVDGAPDLYTAETASGPTTSPEAASSAGLHRRDRIMLTELNIFGRRSCP